MRSAEYVLACNDYQGERNNKKASRFCWTWQTSERERTGCTRKQHKGRISSAQKCRNKIRPRRNEVASAHMKGTMVEHNQERNVMGKHSTGSRCSMYIKKGGESDQGDWERQKGTKDVRNVGCRVVEFRGGVRG